MDTINLSDHPSNNDKTARMVREKRGADCFVWTVYSVRGGFIITFSDPSPHLTFDAVFSSEQDAIAAFEGRSAQMKRAA